MSISLTSECGLRELTTTFCEQAGFQPDIRFEILQQHNKPGQQSQNHVDLFLSSSINPIENDHSVTLLKEDIMLAMPDTDPHARKSSVNLDEFEKAGFISLEAGASLCLHAEDELE